MGFLRPLLVAGLLLAAQEKPSLDKQVDDLVEQLKDFSPDATRAQFLGRPALSKLMGLGPRALPRLKHHLLMEDWRLKSSVGYLAVVLGRSDPEVHARWKELCKDPDLFVRMSMISLSDQYASCVVKYPVMSPEETVLFKRIDLSHPELSWMADSDRESLTLQCLSIFKEGNLLVDPPQLESLGTRQLDPNPQRLRSSGVRLMTPLASMADLGLLRVLQTSTAHKAGELILAAAETDNGSDPPRLGRMLRLASSVLGHRGGCNPRGGIRDCPLSGLNCRRVLALCEKWAWKATDPNAQYGVLWALDCIGLWKAYDLQERLAKDHPDPQVRELAGSNLNLLFNSMYDRRYTREQEAEEDRALEQSKEKR